MRWARCSAYSAWTAAAPRRASTRRTRKTPRSNLGGRWLTRPAPRSGRSSPSARWRRRSRASGRRGARRTGRRGAAERVALEGGRGRGTAEPVPAVADLPGFARSTVDGFAVRAADTYGASEGLPAYLDVAGAVAMGRAPEVAVAPGVAVAIPTGAVLPPGADAVVMVEHTQEAMAGTIEVVLPAAPGDGTVRADYDARSGAEIVPAGRPLRAQDLGLLAAAGVTAVRVHARPRVAIVSTGDEVVPPATG